MNEHNSNLEQMTSSYLFLFKKHTDSEFYLLFSSLYIKLASWPLEWGLSPWWSLGATLVKPYSPDSSFGKGVPSPWCRVGELGFSRAQMISMAFFQSKGLCLRQTGFQPFRHKGYLCLLNAFLCWFASFFCVWAWFPNGSFILHGNFHQSLTTFLIAETTALKNKKTNP